MKTGKSRIYNYVVSKIARKTPFFARSIVESALKKGNTTADTVSPSEMKGLIKEHINPALSKYLPANTSIISLGACILEIDESDGILYANKPFLSLMKSQIGMSADNAQILKYAFKEGYIVSAEHFKGQADDFIQSEKIFEKPFYQVYTLTIFPRKQSDGTITGVTTLLQDITLNHEIENEIHSMYTQLESYRQKVQWELNFASKIQNGILPEPDFIKNGVHYSSCYIPHGPVGGDYFDVIPLSEGRTGILLADVSGHGIPAALVTIMIKSLFLMYAPVCDTPDKVIRQLNSSLKNMLKTGDYMTAFYGILNPDHSFVYASGGHTIGLWVQTEKKKIEDLEPTGSVVGAFEDSIYEIASATIQLEKADQLMLYTDGLTEIRRESDDEEYGTDRLSEYILKHEGASGQELADGIISETGVFCNNIRKDDTTLLFIKPIFAPGYLISVRENALKEMRHGNLKEAYEILDHVYQQDNSLQEILRTMLDIKLQLKEYADLPDLYEHYLEMKQTPETREFIEMARICLKNDKVPIASRYIHEALAINSNYAPALHMMGVVLNKTNQFSKALEYFEKAYKIAPDNETYRKNYYTMSKKLSLKTEGQ